MSMINFADAPPDWLSDSPTAQSVHEIVEFLNRQGTFRFPTLSTGLFSAAASDNPEFRLTGYQNVWVRDNIHIAHALWTIGDTSAAVQPIESFIEFYMKSRRKFVDIIEGRVSPKEIPLRPHIRFDGETLSENEEPWAHAQNDALGYLLWFLCKLLRHNDLSLSDNLRELLPLFVQYFQAIEYWQDEDSGHWEETRKIEASSIGPVVAGLTELQNWLSETSTHLDGISDTMLADAIDRGQAALKEILPAECIQPDPAQNRRYDAALLFLCYPLQIVSDDLTLQIVNDVRSQLMQPIGINRYQGDSYWCADYRTLLSADKRTTDYSDDTSSRDALLKPGEEAQWCIFDPILSVIHAQRFLRSGDAEDRRWQIEHLRRSLAQLTTAESRFGAFRCPESYFLENGEWIPNDICPLLWTQANLRLALHFMQQTCEA